MQDFRKVANTISKTDASGANIISDRLLKLISWNLLHRSGAMVHHIAEIIEKERPDLFLMQEATDEISALSSFVGGSYYAQKWPGKRHGLAAWSSKKLGDSRALELPASKMPGRFPTRYSQVLEVDGVTIANVHLSHGQLLNRRQLRQIAHSTEGPTAIIGDFNVVGPVILPGFRDVGPRGSTHYAQKIIPFRLDRCLIRELRIRSGRILGRGSSDHHPIVMNIEHGEQ